LPAPGGGNAVIPNSGLSTPPVGGSLNTPPNNLAPGSNGNFFHPYGTNGFYRRGTNGDFYLRGTNGFYRNRLRDHRDEFYSDGNMVYRLGPDGMYHWYGAANTIQPPPAFGAGTNGVFGASNNVLPPSSRNPIVIQPQPPR
jgi:hypothetical protein